MSHLHFGETEELQHREALRSTGLSRSVSRVLLMARKQGTVGLRSYAAVRTEKMVWGVSFDLKSRLRTVGLIRSMVWVLADNDDPNTAQRRARPGIDVAC